MKLRFALLFGMLLLSGCATQAYRSVEHECAQTAMADYPANLIQVIEIRQRMVNVPTGMRTCYNGYDGPRWVTLCSPLSRAELVPYQEKVVLDQNEAVRRMAIESCTTNLCQQRYGNAQCKSDQLMVPLPATTP